MRSKTHLLGNICKCPLSVETIRLLGSGGVLVGICGGAFAAARNNRSPARIARRSLTCRPASPTISSAAQTTSARRLTELFFIGPFPAASAASCRFFFAPPLGDRDPDKIESDHRSHEDEHGRGVGCGCNDRCHNGDHQNRIANISSKEIAASRFRRSTEKRSAPAIRTPGRTQQYHQRQIKILCDRDHRLDPWKAYHRKFHQKTSNMYGKVTKYPKAIPARKRNTVENRNPLMAPRSCLYKAGATNSQIWYSTTGEPALRRYRSPR